MADEDVVEMLRKIGRTIENESDAIRTLLGVLLAGLVVLLALTALMLFK